MLKRMLPVVLVLSACDGQPVDVNGNQRSISTFTSRDPIKSGNIRQWQAVDATHVFVLDNSLNLSYGDGVTWQPVKSGVGAFWAHSSTGTLWLKDTSNNLYPWQLGWSQSMPEQVIASNVGDVKVADEDGTVYWMQGNTLHGGFNQAQIDANVAGFFPVSNEWCFDIGSDGKAWSWGWNGSSWVRQYFDGNAIAAQGGCFDNVNGACNSLILGSDRKLWLESNEYGGHGSTPVDANVRNFYGATPFFVFVEGTDLNLWREDVGNGKRDSVDGNVYLFKPIGNDTVWVQDYSGNLWREHLSTTLP